MFIYKERGIKGEERGAAEWFTQQDKSAQIFFDMQLCLAEPPNRANDSEVDMTNEQPSLGSFKHW